MTKDIPLGTRVTIAPNAKVTPYRDAGHFESVDEEVYDEKYLEVLEAPDPDGDYFVTAEDGSGWWYVNHNYVSVYKEEKTVTSSYYEKTYESFAEWLTKEVSYSRLVDEFETYLEKTAPKPNEVWAVAYYGQVEYQRMDDEGIMWLSPEGHVTPDQEEVKPIKKIGVDE